MPTYSVAEFIAVINAQIYGSFSVEGEVSRYGVSQGKWVFFDLKDETAVINCFIPLFKLKTPLEDGMKIKITGGPRVREQTGKFSFTVEGIELVGAGALKRAYELLKLKLTQEGLFASERKRSLPQFPNAIGVIASRDSAAWGDFKRIANNRFGGIELQLYHVTVQGASAESEVVEAFNYFNALSVLPDVLVVIRGGGSLEDLAAFNTEAVVRAVAQSRIPVVSGVGHERDETLCDLAADVRASTPSNAAELTVPDKLSVAESIESNQQYIEDRLKQKLLGYQHKLTETIYILNAGLVKPLALARTKLQQFEQVGNLLEQKLGVARAYLESSERLFKAHDPQRVLKRGFSITRSDDGTILRTADKLKSGDKVITSLSDGQVISRVVLS